MVVQWEQNVCLSVLEGSGGGTSGNRCPYSVPFLSHSERQKKDRGGDRAERDALMALNSNPAGLHPQSLISEAQNNVFPMGLLRR